MSTIYRWKFVPENMKVINENDVFFNRYTSELLDGRASDIIKIIDNSEMQSKYVINSRFDGTLLNVDKLSTGCKTVLNIMYNPDKIIDIRECGENALDVIYALDKGNICSEYPLISFDFEQAEVVDKSGRRIVTDYEELKRWWIGEDKAVINR